MECGAAAVWPHCGWFPVTLLAGAWPGEGVSASLLCCGPLAAISGASRSFLGGAPVVRWLWLPQSAGPHNSRCYICRVVHNSLRQIACTVSCGGKKATLRSPAARQPGENHTVYVLSCSGHKHCRFSLMLAIVCTHPHSLTHPLLLPSQVRGILTLFSMVVLHYAVQYCASQSGKALCPGLCSAPRLVWVSNR